MVLIQRRSSSRGATRAKVLRAPASAGATRRAVGNRVVAVEVRVSKTVRKSSDLFREVELAVDCRFAQRAQRLLGDGGGDILMAVAVAADPGAERRNVGGWKAALGIRGRKSAAGRLINARNDSQSRGHDRQAAFDFLEHGGPMGLRNSVPHKMANSVRSWVSSASFHGPRDWIVEFLPGIAAYGESSRESSGAWPRSMGSEDELDIEPIESGLRLVRRKSPRPSIDRWRPRSIRRSGPERVAVRGRATRGYDGGLRQDC